MTVLQLLLYCLLFTAMVKIAVIGGAVNGLYFYPKEVQTLHKHDFFLTDITKSRNLFSEPSRRRAAFQKARS